MPTFVFAVSYNLFLSFEQLFSLCSSQFCSRSNCLNFEKYRDTDPLSLHLTAIMMKIRILWARGFAEWKTLITTIDKVKVIFRQRRTVLFSVDCNTCFVLRLNSRWFASRVKKNYNLASKTTNRPHQRASHFPVHFVAVLYTNSYSRLLWIRKNWKTYFRFYIWMRCTSPQFKLNKSQQTAKEGGEFIAFSLTSSLEVF